MSNRQLFLVSPYRVPTHSTVYLNADEMAAWLNAYALLWHPACLHGAGGLPEIASPYDHETPTAGHVYVVPDVPTLFLPDDWPERVTHAPAVRVVATADRAQAQAELTSALLGAAHLDSPEESAHAPVSPECLALLETPTELVRLFAGVGLGYLLLDALFEAMDHEKLLDQAAFWADVQAAVSVARTDGAGAQAHLLAAAQKLLAAREVLYSMTIHWLDFVKLDAEQPLTELPSALPVNLIASAAALRRVQERAPAVLADWHQRATGATGTPTLEVLGGVDTERADSHLPVEAQIWNLRHGQLATQQLLGVVPKIYARGQTSFHVQQPALLKHVGQHQALLAPLDHAVVPVYNGTTVNLPTAQGQQIDAFVRKPQPAHEAQTFFNLAYQLKQAITGDTAPTLAFLHEKPAVPSYGDVLALTELAPVFGQITLLSTYFGDTTASEYVSPPGADEFFMDVLDERVTAGRPDAVSAFPRFARQRRRLDAALTLAALGQCLGVPDAASYQQVLDVEARLERLAGHALPPAPGSKPADTPEEQELATLERTLAETLAGRLLSRSPARTPGYLLLNPCSFARRAGLELPGPGLPPVGGPVKVVQNAGASALVVVEVPAFGFAWLPRTGGTSSRGGGASAERNLVRNEFLEAEVDPKTGGLRALRDTRTKVNRIGQMLVFNPGSTMRADGVQITASGPALAEIVSAGVLLDTQGKVLTQFRQRYRAWAGRPVLEVRVEFTPTHAPQGYAWHAYYGARFAWADERAAVLTGIAGLGVVNRHSRPGSGDFIDIRLGKSSVTVFPGGLPFAQKPNARMLDLVLRPAGEQATAFEWCVGIDRELALATALGVVSPVVVVPTEQGPPASGPTGWLFHLDMPSLVATNLRPAPTGVDVQLIESSGYGVAATLQAWKTPTRARLLDPHGEPMQELAIEGDGVLLDVPAGEMVRGRIEFA
jgi:hypothetical protein